MYIPNTKKYKVSAFNRLYLLGVGVPDSILGVAPSFLSAFPHIFISFLFIKLFRKLLPFTTYQRIIFMIYSSIYLTNGRYALYIREQGNLPVNNQERIT